MAKCTSIDAADTKYHSQLSSSITLERNTIEEATALILSVCTKILGEKENIVRMKFGVCSITDGESIHTFDPGNFDTWEMESIDHHQYEHSKEFHGRDGFITLAVVTKESFPEICIDGLFLEALDVKNLLQKHFEKDKRLSEIDPYPSIEDDSKGYVIYMTYGLHLDANSLSTGHGRVIRHENITLASDLTVEKIEECLRQKELEIGRKILYIYIGKSNCGRKEDVPFDPENSNTWELRAIEGRHNDHKHKKYGCSGLIVVAVVTRASIPQRCLSDGCFADPEEYALRLEAATIKKYKKKDNTRICNIGTKPGRTCKEEAKGYVIYVTFGLKSSLKKPQFSSDQDDENSDSYDSENQSYNMDSEDSS